MAEMAEGIEKRKEEVKKSPLNGLFSTKEYAEKMAEIHADNAAFDLAWKKAQCYAQSNILPQSVFGSGNSVANVVVAMEMAKSLGVEPFTFMRGLYSIKGNIAFTSSFVGTMFGSLVKKGIWTPLTCHFMYDDNKKIIGAYYTGTHIPTNTECTGEAVTLEQANKMGWGRNWQTMPEHMLRVRSKVYFIREFAPEALCGGYEESELRDTFGDEGSARKTSGRKLDSIIKNAEVSDA